MLSNIEIVKFNDTDGLVPVVVQDAITARVLMLGYMNRQALEKTLAERFVTFYSRSKQRLWQKGETSGNKLAVVDLSVDCDADALLVLANPQGPTCHTGRTSCFDQKDELVAPFLCQLESTINARKTVQPEQSYTAALFARGILAIAQKVGEEGVEVALAAAAQDKERLAQESADLLYHLLVLLSARDLCLADVSRVLASRNRRQGHALQI